MGVISTTWSVRKGYWGGGGESLVEGEKGGGVLRVNRSMEEKRYDMLIPEMPTFLPF